MHGIDPFQPGLAGWRLRDVPGQLEALSRAAALTDEALGRG